MKTVLSIAGFDPTNGAGTGSDVLTLYQNGVYPLSVVTSVTSQNALGFFARHDLAESVVRSQLTTLLKTHRIDAIKVGMIGALDIAKAIFETLFHAPNCPPLVLDPVICATSGQKLMDDDALVYLKSNVFKRVSLLTPNALEFAILYKANEVLACPTLVKGGHAQGDCDDVLLYPSGGRIVFKGKRHEVPFDHGTGCTLSSAIAAELSKGHSLEMSIRAAKNYLTAGLCNPIYLDDGLGAIRK